MGLWDVSFIFDEEAPFSALVYFIFFLIDVFFDFSIILFLFPILFFNTDHFFKLLKLLFHLIS